METIIPIIRTRFSVNSGKWPGFIPDKNWLDFRAALLKKTSLQSLLRQTRKDFIWFIEASPETYDYVSELVKSLNMPNAQALLSEGSSDGEGYVKFSQSIQNELPESEDYMLIRLDSDDMLHPKTVEMFCENANKQYPIIGVNKGYKFNWSTGEVAIHLYKDSSCFGMLTSNKELTFGKYGHKTIRYHHNSMNLIDIPFVQICHGSNVRVGFLAQDKQIEGKDITSFYETYGLEWDKQLKSPEGNSNPQVVLRHWLKYGNKINSLKSKIKNILGISK